MVILRSQNKFTDFLMILAWASPFNVGEILHDKNMSSWYTVIVNTTGDSMCDADKINEKYINLVASKNVKYINKILLNI